MVSAFGGDDADDDDADGGDDDADGDDDCDQFFLRQEGRAGRATGTGIVTKILGRRYR